MLRQLIAILALLVFLSCLYALLQRFWPSLPGQKTYRPGFWTDLSYWLSSPILNRGVVTATLILILIPISLATGVALKDMGSGWGPLGHLPMWLQALAIVGIGDFIGYWVHRYTHAGWWWKVHSIHHSSPQLDWLAAARVHPFNDALGVAARILPLMAMGFAPAAVAGIQPVFILYAVTLHANLNWDYGPFRKVIASPRFHRWHHTSAEAGRDKNFAALLPIWDLLFGTYFMPEGEQPTSFGIAEPVPSSLWGQLAWPLRNE